MSISLAKNSIDLGIVTRNADAMVAFYRDVIGLEYQAETPMPGGGIMHRLMCGDSLIKVVTPGKLKDATAAPGGIGGASGYRYWTISVDNLDAVAAACTDAGAKLPVAPLEIRPGIRIFMVEDPDGNWLELLEDKSS